MKKTQLSKEAEELIVSALQKVAEHVDDGLDPDTAITKVASSGSIPDGLVRLMVHAYNIGVQTEQRKLAADRAGKAGEVKLANFDRIIESLYPSKPKTASEKHQEACVSSEYDAPPLWTLERERQEKAAALRTTVKTAAAQPRRLGRTDDATHIFSGLERLKRACIEAHMTMTNAGLAVSRKVEELNTLFRRGVDQPFPNVFDNAELLHGKKAAALRETILEMSPYLRKQASSKKLTRATGPAYTIIGECIKLADAYFVAKDNYHDTVAKAEATRKELIKPLNELLPKVAHVSDSIMAEEQTDDCDRRGLFRLPFGQGKSATVIPLNQVAKTMAASSILKGLMKQFPGAGTQELPPVISPTHASELRNVQLESMLSDLMANDPYIQGSQNPDEVLDSYNEISQMAPRAAGEKAIVRAFLRRRLQQGQLGEFDLKNLLDLEKNLTEVGSPGTIYPSLPEAPSNGGNA